MSLNSPNRLGANFNPIHANILEQQNAAAAAANAQQGNNHALQNQGNEFILAAVSSTINLPVVLVVKALHMVQYV